MINKTLNRTKYKISNILSNLFKRVIIQTVNDSNDIQLLQVKGLSGEVLSDVENIQHGGVSHVSSKGEQAILLSIGNKNIVISVDNGKNRPKGDDGDTIIYDNHGNKIELKDGKININCKNCNVNLEPGGKLDVADGNFTVEY